MLGMQISALIAAIVSVVSFIGIYISLRAAQGGAKNNWFAFPLGLLSAVGVMYGVKLILDLN